MKKGILVLAAFILQLVAFGQVNKANKFVVSGDVFGRRVFIKNNGQFNKDIPEGQSVKYAYVNGAEKVYFSSTGLTYFLEKVYPLTHHQFEMYERGETPKLKPSDKYYVNVSWENANPNMSVEESEKQSFYHSFGDKELKSDCYKKITYKNVYNNIDIEYVFTNEKSHGIKYNVILHPGANINDVKIKYTGDVKGISIKKGDVIIKTPLENIIEHAPISFQNNTAVESNFIVADNTIGFSFPNGYNANEELVIDPWVSNITLATNNYGYDVDYDYAGNYYVYGGSGPYLIAKYNAAGTLIWTFGGTVPSQTWISNQFGYIGNFLVDKFTGKSYQGEGFSPTVGTRIVRIDANGIYDNFISVGLANWKELWDMTYYCSTGAVFGMGGTTATNQSAGILNTNNGSIVAQNFTGLPVVGQDVVSAALDPAGNLFIIYADAGSVQVNNALLRVNAAFNGNVWFQPSTYNSFQEAANKNAYVGAAANSNGFNALEASANYLYYYDGFNLAAYNKNTGAKIGFITIPGHTVKQQGGIAVDDCENVYIGGNNQILCYNFNGTTFNALPSIPSGATTTNKYIYDIKYIRNTNLLHVCGSGFGGVYSAINSTTCTILQMSITPICVGNNNGMAVATITTNIVNPITSYSWTNSSNVIVSQTLNSALLTNTASGLANGNYTLFAQINAPCGPVITQTVNINCVCSVTAVATSSCITAGISTSLNLGAISGYTTSPITYSWTGPGGYTAPLNTSAAQTLSTAVNGIYTLTAVSPSCTSSGTVLVTVPSIFTVSVANSSVSCYNGSNGTASVSAITGTSTGPYSYLWSNTQTSVQINSLTIGNYTCAVTDALGCTYFGTTNIIQPAQAFLTLANTSVSCNNGSNGTASVATIPIANTGPYTYTWSSNPIQNSSQANGLIAGTYSCTLQDAIGCIFTGTTTLIQPAQAFLTLANTSVTCNNGSNGTASVATIPIANTGPYTYTWSSNPIQNSSVASGLIAGTYSCALQDAIGCIFTGTTTLIQPTTVSVSISTNTDQVCMGNSITFTGLASGGTGNAYGYAWSSGALTSVTSISEANGGIYTYTVTASDINTCTATAVHTVTFILNPVLTAANKDICYGQSVNLTANGANSYSWSPSTGLNFTTGSGVIANPAQTTIYTILGNNSFCTGVTTLTLNVVQYPDAIISCPNQEICEGASTSINASGAQGYNWMPNYAISSTSGSAVIVAPLVNTTYTITSYNMAGTVVCSETKQMPIVVVPQTTPSINADKVICAGEKVNLLAGGGNTYAWTPTVSLNQNTTPGVVANPNATTIYSVLVSNNGFCGHTATVAVQVNPNPVVFAGRDTIFNLDEPMFLNATGTGTLTWIDGQGIFCAVCPNTKINATSSGCYVIETVNQFGCKAKDDVCIEITTDFGVYIPNIFTPNEDGLNDVFYVKGYSISDVTMDIFDRWGERLFGSNDQKFGWNGTYKGVNCKNDVYIYKVTYKGLDGKKYYKTGHVTLSK